MTHDSGVLKLFGDMDPTERGAAFDTVMDELPVNVTIADARLPDMPLVYANKAFLHTTGYGADEVLGHNCRFLQGEETDPTQVAAIREAVAAGRSLDIELLNYRKNGEPFWNALKLRPIHGKTGEISHFVGIQRDITAERNVMRGALQRSKLEALGRMAGALTHELNNLLQPTVNFVRFAHDEVTKDAPDMAKARGYLERGLGAARSAKTVTKDLESYARRWDTTEPLRFESDMAASVAAAVKVAALALPETVHFDFEATEAPFELEHDPDSVAEVLKELFANAAAAMAFKGKITCRSRVIEPCGALEIIVCDSGPGIDPISRAKVFDPFYTTKPAGHGSGLGLSIVYNIVCSWGGEIGVDGAPDGGARFKIIIPVRSTILHGG